MLEVADPEGQTIASDGAGFIVIGFYKRQAYYNIKFGTVVMASSMSSKSSNGMFAKKQCPEFVNSTLGWPTIGM